MLKICPLRWYSIESWKTVTKYRIGVEVECTNSEGVIVFGCKSENANLPAQEIKLLEKLEWIRCVVERPGVVIIGDDLPPE